MLDQVFGKPSSSWKRTQVLLVLLFWISRIVRGSPEPRLRLIRKLNARLARFTPWQLILSTLTTIYAIKNSDKILGLQAPEPLARLYSRDYYRATWIVTALDAGFATAMPVKPKWLRDILSVAFAGYYLVFAHEADEKLRKYRAVCTVEMLRTTWEKTSNPYIRFATRGDRPKVGINKRILLPRPKGSSYTKPILAWLFFDGTEAELAQSRDLIFDLPGGGFICMTPEHHEERTLRWTIKTKRPVLSFDYGKAPEYPFPFAIDEAYDAYRLLVESQGRCIGMSGQNLSVVMTGDSAGANIAAAMVIKILETRPRLPLPVSLVLSYAALDFNFTSWMSASNIKVLRQESSANIAAILRDKEHLDHRSPLSVVADVERPRIRKRRTSSWGRSLVTGKATEVEEEYGDDESETGANPFMPKEEKDKSLSERVVYWDPTNEKVQAELLDQATAAGEKVLAKAALKGPLETRLAMTSRTAFFSDRIISPPMCRAMALLYVGPRNAPDLHTDYHISPIFTPASLLAQFPPVYLACGERDPFVDDTVIFAGKVREAKESRKMELQARQSKFGEGLRMSTSAIATRDPILDEDEDDWVQMKILEGWSHGYLQMMSLLPGSVHTIDMLAEWIVTSFEKHDAQRSQTASPPSATLTAPTPPLNANVNNAATVLAAQKLARANSESDKDDDMLSFTPRKRGTPTIASRSASPCPATATTAAPRRPTSMSSSDDASSSLPRTPPHLSPPSDSAAPESLIHPAVDHLQPLSYSPKLKQLVTPHHHALREELSNSLMLPSSAPLGSARSVSTSLPSGSPPILIEGGTATVKTGRSNSFETGTTHGFVDAKEMLRRRRADVVFGISGANSAVGSDDEV